MVLFAQVAERVTRPTDQLYRMGGEEFCFILPDTELREAIAAAERIRQAFELATVDVRGHAVGTTVSIGIASAHHAGFALELLLESADAALYEAKARGRNQIVVADATALRRPVDGALGRRRSA
ncbi:MAG: GGDEF domain-containing protein [Hyphomicrobiales bacterium]|nr:MAG: GGDEF domain-containing protein [Hyphomicrobiales bacterium]